MFSDKLTDLVHFSMNMFFPNRNVTVEKQIQITKKKYDIYHSLKYNELVMKRIDALESKKVLMLASLKVCICHDCQLVV